MRTALANAILATFEANHEQTTLVVFAVVTEEQNHEWNSDWILSLSTIN